MSAMLIRNSLLELRHVNHPMPVMNPVTHANAYEHMENTPRNAHVSASYQSFINELCHQYDVLITNGLRVTWVSGEPYADSAAMRRDVLDNSHINVRLTVTDTYSDIQDADHPMLEFSEPLTTFGQKVHWNDLFRCVHDVLGHTASMSGFGPDGETLAWLTHRTLFSSEALLALWCETRGQASWTNDFANHRELPLIDRPFTVQKSGIPDNWELLV